MVSRGCNILESPDKRCLPLLVNVCHTVDWISSELDCTVTSEEAVTHHNNDGQSGTLVGICRRVLQRYCCLSSCGKDKASSACCCTIHGYNRLVQFPLQFLPCCSLPPPQPTGQNLWTPTSSSYQLGCARESNKQTLFFFAVFQLSLLDIDSHARAEPVSGVLTWSSATSLPRRRRYESWLLSDFLHSFWKKHTFRTALAFLRSPWKTTHQTKTAFPLSAEVGRQFPSSSPLW